MYLTQPTNDVVALDAKTGKEVWKAVNADPKREFVRERDFLHDVLQAAW